MDNSSRVLSKLIVKAKSRIAEITSGTRPTSSDQNARYFAEVIVDLDKIDEPMIADPDVNNIDISKRYTRHNKTNIILFS